MNALVILLASTLIIMWLPMLLNFLRAWRARHNPVSLAIVGIILTLIHANLVTVVVIASDTSVRTVLGVGLMFNLIACLNCHLAFAWSKRKFPEQRGAATIPNHGEKRSA